jgi:tetratricopeptide (TPR) repeat protein
MEDIQRGRLILKEAKGEDVEAKVVSYLLKIVKNISPEDLTAKVRNAPLLLAKNIPSNHGEKIASDLVGFGADAFFEPHKPIKPEPVKAEPPESDKSINEKNSFSSTYASKAPVSGGQAKHSWIRTILLLLALFCAIGFLVYQYYPEIFHGEIFSTLKKMTAIVSEDKAAKPKPKAKPKYSKFNTLRPYNEHAPSIMEVDPQNIYEVFLHQYRMPPDKRLVEAFTVLTKCYNRYYRTPAGQSPFQVGTIKSDGNQMIVSLLDKGKTLAEITVSLPMTFSQGLTALDNWILAMDKKVVQPTTNDGNQNPTPMENLEKAKAYINMVDPRAIIMGLSELENIKPNSGPDPQTLHVAVRGYSMLLLALTPDKMEYTDSMAAHALSFLAMAKRLSPSSDLITEEAFLAMNMGYTAHAENLFEDIKEEASDPADKMITAFMRKDIKKLEGLLGGGSDFLGYYLLTLLYREMGLYKEAEQVAKKLFNEFPDCYPSLIEIINSGSLGQAKMLTLLYPLEILGSMEQQLDQKFLPSDKTWEERLKAVKGAPNTANISISYFESLLEKWRPMGEKGDNGLIINDKMTKNVFKTLYTDALYLRFYLLFSRWCVVEKAWTFVQSLEAEDKDYPLVMGMMAKILKQMGNTEEANKLALRVIKHPDTSNSLALWAFFTPNEHMEKVKIGPDAAYALDGRPTSLSWLGSVFQYLYNYDFAEKYFILALERNPYLYDTYFNLFHVTKSSEPIIKAMTIFPDNFVLLERIGDYLVGAKDTKVVEFALKCYEKALELSPTNRSLPKDKAWALRRLNRYDEAAEILRVWLDEDKAHDLVTISYKAALAETYLEMGKPQLAMELVDMISSYKANAMIAGANVYEANGRKDEAEKVWIKVVNRYPSSDGILSEAANFYWRNGSYKEAASLIAQGRKIKGKISQWYFIDFKNAFKTASDDEMLKAVDILKNTGAGTWELQSLAMRISKYNRPEAAYRILQKVDVQGTMLQLEKKVNIYKVLQKSRGQDDALKYLNKAVPQNLRGHLTMVLYDDGLFEAVLDNLKNPEKFSEKYREFVWLQRLIAWHMLENKPDALASEFENHYKKSSTDYYHAIGCYLMGNMSRRELLQKIETPKQRCEFTYYIGLSERLKGNFAEAANWYHLCSETQLENNGEFHWATTELFWWAHMGTTRRHRSIADDKRLYDGKIDPAGGQKQS